MTINSESVRDSALSFLVSNPLTSRIIDLTKDYLELEYLFERNGIPCFSKGDIHVVKGKAKAGKSTFIVTLVTALISGDNFGFKAIKTGLRTLYVDTEQNPVNTANVSKKIHRLCGLSLDKNYECFTAMNLRGDSPKERKKFICEAIEKCKPNFVIIDGVKDLVEGGDINSPKDATETIQFLMTLTKNYNISILTVLHENKNDDNLRGHVGAELLNKCSEVWQIKKFEDRHEVEQTVNRNAPSKQVKYAYRYNSSGLPEPVEIQQNISEVNFNKKVETIQNCFKDGINLDYRELKLLYCKISGYAIKTAEKHITELKKKGYLIQNERTCLYSFNQNKLPLSA